MQNEIDHELLKKFISGECTREEAVQVRKFLLRQENSHKLEKILDDQWSRFEDQWNHSGIENTSEAPEMEKWTQAFRQRKKKLLEEQEKRRKREILHKWTYIAAAACLLPILVFLTFHVLQKSEEYRLAHLTLKEVRTEARQTIQVRLSDGTCVFMGPKSRLSYPEKFEGSMRKVRLEGEALFDVTKDPEHPFVISSGEISTRVLGTSFKVEAYSGSWASVSVVRGKVRVAGLQGTSEKALAVLTPGKQVRYDFLTKKAEVSDFDLRDVTAWKDGRLAFRSVPLRDVLQSLERWYNVRITMKNPQLQAEKVQLFIDGREPVDEAIETLGQTTGLSYRIKGNEISMYE